MRILVVGAGATGGYFGGRLLQAGRDVTFLVRARRADQLKRDGLVIKTPSELITLGEPKTVLAENLHEPYDLIILSCKSYDLENAMESFAPAVGATSAIIPLLNGMRHLDVLDARFGAAHVLGGRCLVSSTLDDEGRIVQFIPMHTLTYGERDGSASERMRTIEAEFSGAGFDQIASREIVQDMWEKWVGLGTLAGATCLMRASIGEILSTRLGAAVIDGIFAECSAIAAAKGHAPRPAFVAQMQASLSDRNSALTASMLRDIERKSAIEADQIVGGLVEIASQLGMKHDATSLLALAYTHLKAYEARRSR